MKKRGLSPVIASVLLIALVLVIAALILLWSRGFLSEQIEKFGNPINNLCEAVDFKVALIPGIGDYDNLEVINRGNVNINSLEFKLSKKGNSETKNLEIQVYASESESKEVDLTMKDGTYPEKISVYPVLVGNIKGKNTPRDFVCVDQYQDLV